MSVVTAAGGGGAVQLMRVRFVETFGICAVRVDVHTISACKMMFVTVWLRSLM